MPYRDAADPAIVTDVQESAVESLQKHAVQTVAKAELSLDNAVQAARDEIGRHRNTVIREGKIRGRAGEILAHEGHPGTLDLNEVCCAHFPVHDLVGRRGFISVKTRVDRPDGSLPVESYAHDLRVVAGVTRRPEYGRYAGMTGVDLAARRLWQMRENDPEGWKRLTRYLPDGARSAGSDTELSAAMQKDHRLAIPEDHVKPAREYVERVAQLHPQLYGLPEDQSEQELVSRARELACRIVPAKSGINSKMIADRVNAFMRRRHK